MKYIDILRNLFLDKKLKNINVDDLQLLKHHQIIIEEKNILKSAYISFYETMLNFRKKYFTANGKELELGSGISFFKKINSCLITSDVRKYENIDLIINAEKIQLENNSIKCVYAQNVLHHLRNPYNFFSELNRILIKGGGCILIEPHNGFLSKFFHKIIHKSEIFDTNQPDWINTNIQGPYSGANQALSYIIFERDKSKFQSLYGENFQILDHFYINNYLRFLFSGGLNFKQLLPDFFLNLLILLERTLKPFNKYLSLHRAIVIKKIK